MEPSSLRIRVETENVAEAGKLARELSDAIREEAPDVQVSLARDDPESQDLGTILELVHPYVHGTAFTLETLHAVVAGIMIWKEWRRNKPLIVEGPEGSLRIDGESSAEKLIEQLHSLFRQGGESGRPVTAED